MDATDTLTHKPPTHLCTLLPDGRQFASEGGQTLLAAALSAGMAVPFSCQRGACGSCRAQVVTGSYERISAPSPGAYAVEAGELLMCQCRATSDLSLGFSHWQAPATPPGRRQARVAALEPLSPEVTRLRIELEGDEPYSGQAGQHVRLPQPDGAARCFSVASLVGERGLEFHIRRVPGGAFTDRRLAALLPGDALEIDGPHGSCVWPAPGTGDARHLVLLATGTGFAGLRAILLKALQEKGFDTLALYWGGRHAWDCYAADELDALTRLHANFQWRAVLPAHAAGHVQDVAVAAGHDWPRSLVYACGNPAMVGEARALLRSAGLPRERFFAESFLPAGLASAPVHPWEKVGGHFTLQGILEARKRSIEAVEQIAALLKPGITTGEAIALADAHMNAMGSPHNWHPTYIRFGPDTVCTWRDPVDRQRRLAEEDIIVIDIGPVWDGYEGDYGDTFVRGGNATQARCAQAARDIFDHTHAAWLQGMTGQALYALAQAHAHTLGCVLVEEVPGHRVSDFPHALYGKQPLAEADFIPAEGIWVLEIQVRDQALPVGAFFEDVLLQG